MRRRIAVLLAMAVMLAMMVAGPALAHGGHTSCQGFGTGIAALAKDAHPFGQNVVSPGPANEDIQGFHATFCEPKS